MGQITATRNLVATKVVRLAGQSGPSRHSPFLPVCKFRALVSSFPKLLGSISKLSLVEILGYEWSFSAKNDTSHGKYRADFRFAASQWETALLCNDVSHWLGASPVNKTQSYNIFDKGFRVGASLKYLSELRGPKAWVHNQKTPMASQSASD